MGHGHQEFKPSAPLTPTQQVNSNIVGVSAASEDTGKSAGEVLGAAQNLSRQSEALKEEIGKFLTNVKAA